MQSQNVTTKKSHVPVSNMADLTHCLMLSFFLFLFFFFFYTARVYSCLSLSFYLFSQRRSTIAETMSHRDQLNFSSQKTRPEMNDHAGFSAATSWLLGRCERRIARIIKNRCPCQQIIQNRSRKDRHTAGLSKCFEKCSNIPEKPQKPTQRKYPN